MRRTIARFGIVPVFGDGSQPVYLVDADELARAVVALVTDRAHGAFACASAEPIRFRDLCEAIGAAAGRRVRCVPVPVGLALAVVGLAERLGIRPPVSSESVRGIANLREVDVPAYSQIGFAFLSPRDAVRRAAMVSA
jgi:nucleoside-diphosphate-sugar epimerase